MSVAVSTAKIALRSLEDSDLGEVHRQQNGPCRREVSGMLGFEPPWAPMAVEQVKAKVDEVRKEKRRALFALQAEDGAFVGLGYFSAEWDPWCPDLSVLVWPERRRQGSGSAAARLLLAICFDETPAHVVSAWVPDFELAGIAFAETLGFKRAGVGRRAGMHEGRPFDGVFLDLLRAEYRARKAKGGDP